MIFSLPRKRLPRIRLSPLAFAEQQFGIGVELIGQCIILFLQTLYYIWQGFLDIFRPLLGRESTGAIDWRETVRQAYMIGVKSFIVVGVTALFVGFAMSLQIARELVLFGGDTAIGGVVALALVREIGPITAGVIVAGRVGSAIAAELTTMMITERIDALKVMRIDPVQFLVVPRYLAGLFMMPVLAIYSMFIGLFSGIMIAHSAANLPPATFLDSVKQTILDRDFTVHFIKSILNATIVIIFSCAIGLHTRGGAEDVGIATTRTIVWTMTVIFIVNYLVTALTYAPR